MVGISCVVVVMVVVVVEVEVVVVIVVVVSVVDVVLSVVTISGVSGMEVVMFVFFPEINHFKIVLIVFLIYPLFIVRHIRGLPFSTYASRGGWVWSSLLYISIAYYMQKGGGWVQIACKIAYVLNGRPLSNSKQITNLWRSP